MNPRINSMEIVSECKMENRLMMKPWSPFSLKVVVLIVLNLLLQEMLCLSWCGTKHFRKTKSAWWLKRFFLREQNGVVIFKEEMIGIWKHGNPHPHLEECGSHQQMCHDLKISSCWMTIILKLHSLRFNRENFSCNSFNDCQNKQKFVKT